MRFSINILFIDASNDFEAGKNQNILRECDIDKIVETYEHRVDVDKYAHVATMQEIEENGFNLNIPRYDNGLFGASDTLSREQLVTILWRYAGSPVLMDYPGLSNYMDAKDISAYARQAMAWAHQKDLLAQTTGKIQPQASVTAQEAADMIDAIGIKK